MHGVPNLASVATSIAIGISLLAGFFSMWIAVRSGKDATEPRDTAVSILFGIAFLLMALTGTAVALIAVRGMTCVGVLKAALLPTAAFAVVGMVFGLVRGLRSGRAIKHEARE